MHFLFHFLFGLFFGYFAELIYKWYWNGQYIRPRFVNIQIYGFAIALIYIIFLLNFSLPIVALLLAIVTTGLEFLTGYLYLKFKNIRLWDYTTEAFNYNGLICLKFSLYWLVLALIYYWLLGFIYV